MKKIFDKLNKIMFVLGIAALVILVLIMSGWLAMFGESTVNVILLVCLAAIFVFAIFVAISVVLAIIDGLKKDKIAFLKKFLSNVAWIAIAYVVVFGLDYFVESEFPIEMNLGKVALQVLISALAIIGGEYMLTNHSKEKEDELHF